MKVCIHRGTKEIGGTCVEIEAQGKSLVLDVGLPLDASDPDDIPLHPVRGFAAPDASLLGVVISHPHQDHYGLAYRLPEETQFLIGKAAEAILDAAALFSPSGLKLKNVKHLSDRTPIVLGPFTIVTIFKACLASKRQFIVDMYTAEILRATDNPRLPQAEWNGVRVFLPDTQRWRIKKEKAFDISDSYKPHRIHWNQLAGAASKSVMLFRPSMVRDLERAECLTGGCVVCSVWDGYLEGEKNQWFGKWRLDRGLQLHPCHTSGHASVPDLRRMRDAFPHAIAVPVHLSDQERFSALFSNVRRRDDGEWWEV